MGEYMSFMISRETENVGSSQEVINAFKALTEGGKRPYVTEAELYQVMIQNSVDTLSCLSCYFVLIHKFQFIALVKLSLTEPSRSRIWQGYLTLVLIFFLSFSFQSLTKEQAEYCIERMRPYVDDKGREIPGAYDYKTFCEELFSSS